MLAQPRLEEHLEFPKLELCKQRSKRVCGIAVIRSILRAQFGEDASEREVINAIARIQGWEHKRDYHQNRKRIKDGYYNESGRKIDVGTPPKYLADYFKDRFPSVKFFCSKQGTIDNLELLLSDFKVVPIIHMLVSYPEDGDFEVGGHYLVYGGKVRNVVRIYDVAQKEGFKYYSVREFYRRWYNPQFGEHWLGAVVPEEPQLPKEEFAGRYL